jgi:hypothetical protein
MKNHEMTPPEGSFWLQMCPATDFPMLERGLEVEVVVLGGGVAGITTATLFKDVGHYRDVFRNEQSKSEKAR